PELELPGRRRPTLQDLTVDAHADPAPAVRVGIDLRSARRLRARWDGRTGVDAARFVDADVLELGVRNRLLVHLADLARDLERAVAAHVRERRQAFGGRGLGQSRHRVLEDPTVVLVHGHLLAGALPRLEEL